MNKLKFCTAVLIVSLSILPNAYSGDFPFLTTGLFKKYQDTSVYPHKDVEVMINVITNTEVDSNRKKESIFFALKNHERLTDAFIRSGWRECHLLDNKFQVGHIELVFEPRMNLKFDETIVIKTFVYVCESDKLWNMLKYRGGNIEKYFDKVVVKTENCIKDNEKLSDMRGKG